MPKVQPLAIATVRGAYPDIVPLFHTRRREEGYRSMSDYFFWTAFYDVLVRKPHHVSAHVAHLSEERQRVAVAEVVAHFDDPHKPGGLFQSRLIAAAQEETWVLHARIRERDDRIRELEQELARERGQGKL